MAVTNREEQILGLIRQNPMISQNELAHICGITRSGVAAHISNLVKKGYLLGKGYIVSPPTYVAVIGGINLDIYGMSVNPVVSHSSNVGKITFSPGGIGRNISYNLGCLGVKNYLLSVYGDDHNGAFFKKDAMANGLDITYCQQLSNTPTSTYLSVSGPDGDPMVGLDDMASSELISPTFLRERAHIIVNANAVVLDSSLTAASIAWICDHYSGPIYARVVSVNKASRLMPVLNRIDTLVLSRAESQLLTNTDASDEQSGQFCARFLHEAGVRCVYLLIDGVGNLYSDGSQYVFCPDDQRTKSRHNNGAASAALSALLWSHSKKMGYRDCAETAYAAAAMAMDCVQSVNPSLSPKALEARRHSFFARE
ncbi:winged helix-turn-helix transcriptional regulator [Bifidobacterium sp. B4081]|uniref:PfkB family carbohydrate kinase n=1 Tax=unclassified Bifidobacterium TaxID=2608897 RepID=UPI002269E539|nr:MULTISPECIES: PfkB family carbohydrate kinase [unclassified Bifidobacterium]MCX8643323.1 winged helix-turn-helix transcriptional regulator [Bifidobacterium sp. B4077]MCX8645505.1 winged helix-turn-helix transcriptional regulator [Bifidobacterium sp. B4081]MCX8668784.1 winged helix-turn-helix transcriptional regulator [Bifidobacterium sp. B3998]